jgi:hypothetical protein
VLVDGGVWANNATMLAVIEALTCFDIGRDQIDVLSLGCGDDPFVVSGSQIIKGGIWHWKKIMFAAMRLQSLAATNQTRLLLGLSVSLLTRSPGNRRRYSRLLTTARNCRLRFSASSLE